MRPGPSVPRLMLALAYVVLPILSAQSLDGPVARMDHICVRARATVPDASAEEPQGFSAFCCPPGSEVAVLEETRLTGRLDRTPLAMLSQALPAAR